MTDEEILEALEGGKTYILEHGWVRKIFKAKDGRVCALGGVLSAQGYVLPVDQKYLFGFDGLEAVVKRYNLTVGDRMLATLGNAAGQYASVTAYNDSHSTAEADVLAMFDNAILATKQRIADEG